MTSMNRHSSRSLPSAQELPSRSGWSASARRGNFEVAAPRSATAARMRTDAGGRCDGELLHNLVLVV